MMASFSQEIYRLVSCGLDELLQSQLAGKTPKNPLSETHFFSAWVSKSLKQHRFDRCVIIPLAHWQRQARTLGADAQLKQQFSDIARTYDPMFNGLMLNDKTLVNNDSKLLVTRGQVDSILTRLNDIAWSVTRDIVISGKVSLKSNGASSLVMCAKQVERVFCKNGQLVKPLSLYARGASQELIDISHRYNVLLHQVTQYKSKVKYHGEYVIYPENSGVDLPCIPSDMSIGINSLPWLACPAYKAGR